MPDQDAAAALVEKLHKLERKYQHTLELCADIGGLEYEAAQVKRDIKTLQKAADLLASQARALEEAPAPPSEDVEMLGAAFRAEVDCEGCESCQAGRLWRVVGPDDFALGTMYGDREEAEWVADCLNDAYEHGRASGLVTLRTERDLAIEKHRLAQAVIVKVGRERDEAKADYAAAMQDFNKYHGLWVKAEAQVEELTRDRDDAQRLLTHAGLLKAQEDHNAQVAALTRERDAAVHGLALIEPHTTRGITDCSTPLHIRVQNIVQQLESAERERDAARAEGRREGRKEIAQFIMDERGVRTPCGECSGLGVKTYGSTSTWRGGVGGQMMTAGVCNRCWGSGDANRPWPSWRIASPKGGDHA
jgi:hypothetical protein